MINLERINNVVGALEKVVNDLQNVNKLSDSIDKSTGQIDKLLKDAEKTCEGINKYDAKVLEVDKKVGDLIGKLQDIRTEYRRVLSISETVETDLKMFQSKLDLAVMDIAKEVKQTVEEVKKSGNIVSDKITKSQEELKKEITDVKRSLKILTGICIGFGLVIAIGAIVGFFI